jgi:hypothetical protein
MPLTIIPRPFGFDLTMHHHEHHRATKAKGQQQKPHAKAAAKPKHQHPDPLPSPKPRQPGPITLIFDWSTDMNRFTCHAELTPVVPGTPVVAKRTCLVQLAGQPDQSFDMALDAVATPSFVGNEGDALTVTVTDFTALNVASVPAVLSCTLAIDHAPPATPGTPKLVVDSVEVVPDPAPAPVAPPVEPAPAPAPEVPAPPADVPPVAPVAPAPVDPAAPAPTNP